MKRAKKCAVRLIPAFQHFDERDQPATVHLVSIGNDSYVLFRIGLQPAIINGICHDVPAALAVETDDNINNEIFEANRHRLAVAADVRRAGVGLTKRSLSVVEKTSRTTVLTV